MQSAYDLLAVKFPNFTFKGYLMDIKGNCKELEINREVKYDHTKTTATQKDSFLT